MESKRCTCEKLKGDPTGSQAIRKILEQRKSTLTSKVGEVNKVPSSFTVRNWLFTKDLKANYRTRYT